MNSITLSPQMQTELAPVNGADWLDNIESLSALSPEVALNQPLIDLVQTTLTAAAGDSENTARAYQTAIGLFLQFLDDQLGDRLPQEWRPLANPSKDGKKTVWEFRGMTAVLRTVTAGTLESFVAWRNAEGNGKATRALRQRAVNTFLRVAYREGVLEHRQAHQMGLNPYKKRERRDEKPVGRRLSAQEVRKLRAIVELKGKTERKVLRDRAILDLMLYAGLRRSEVASLKTSDLKQDNGRWWLVLVGKGQKTRRVKMHDTPYKSLETWLSDINLETGKGDDPLFHNLNKGGDLTGTALNSSVIGRLVAEYGFLAGLAPARGENVLSPHDLRRTCARNAFDNGASLPQVQMMLGHADIKTTMRYIGSQHDDENTAVDFVHY
jgi:integrase